MPCNKIYYIFNIFATFLQVVPAGQMAECRLLTLRFGLVFETGSSVQFKYSQCPEHIFFLPYSWLVYRLVSVIMLTSSGDVMPPAVGDLALLPSGGKAARWVNSSIIEDVTANFLPDL